MADLAVEAARERVIIAAMDESMRWVRAVCVVGVVGCGYPQLVIVDAPPPSSVDAPPQSTADAPPDAALDLTHVALTWQLATTSTSGAPSPPLDYPPLAVGAAQARSMRPSAWRANRPSARG